MVSMKRPSRGERWSATTTLQIGFFLLPTRVRRTRTDIAAPQDSRAARLSRFPCRLQGIALIGEDLATPRHPIPEGPEVKSREVGRHAAAPRPPNQAYPHKGLRAEVEHLFGGVPERLPFLVEEIGTAHELFP